MEVRQTRYYTRFKKKLDVLHDFPDFLKDFFEPYIRVSANNNGSSFEWSAVDIFYNNFQDKLSLSYGLNMFCRYVVGFFLKFNCEHERLLRKITYMYFQVLARNHGNLEARYCDDCDQMNCYLFHHLDSRPLLRKVNEQLDRIYNVRKFISSNFCFDVIEVPPYNFLRYLIKYGLTYVPDCVEKVSRRFFDLRQHYYYERDIILDDLYRGRDDEVVLFNQLLSAMRSSNFRRLFLVMQVVTNYLLDENDEHAKNITLYSLTISEPVISQKEVQEFLDCAFANDEIFKNDAFSSFKNVFADSPKLPSPRSLKNLCRCKIRDCLPRSPPMPTMLYQIEMLPNCLKEYILFLRD